MSVSGYDEEFALAMKTKLKLNRETRVKRRRTASEPIPSTLRVPDREAIIREVLAERPGLTREKLLIQMAALGF